MGLVTSFPYLALCQVGPRWGFLQPSSPTPRRVFHHPRETSLRM